MRELRFQQICSAAFACVFLGLAGSCVEGGSDAVHVAPDVLPALPGNEPGHMRPPLEEGGFDTTPTPEEAEERQTEHTRYTAPVMNMPTTMMPDPATPGEFVAAPSLTLGSREETTGEGEDEVRTTSDSVFTTTLTRGPRGNAYGGVASSPASVSIDVGNDGTMVLDLLSSTASLRSLPQEGGLTQSLRALGDFASRANAGQVNQIDIGSGRDRRLGLGQFQNNEDPQWYYTSRTFLRDVDDDGDTDDAGDFEVHLVDWSFRRDTLKELLPYMGGGFWSYNYDSDLDTAGIQLATAVGVFTTGSWLSGIGNTLQNPTGNATYRGHTFGQYTVLPAVLGAGGVAEDNVGFFAAKATINAHFTGPSASGPRITISGQLTDFQFNTNLFDEAGRSSLDVIGGENGLSINLQGEADRTPPIQGDTENDETFASRQATYERYLRLIAIHGDLTPVTVRRGSNGYVNLFAGTTTSDGLMIGDEGDQELELTGSWAGRLAGNSRISGQRIGTVPLAFGGTWGASGAIVDASSNVLFALSLIGSFGTSFDRVIDIHDGGSKASGEFAGAWLAGTANPDHDYYGAAIANTPLIADGLATDSSITIGTLGPAGTTDRVFFNLVTANTSTPDTGLTIDVGNTPGTGDDLVSTASTGTGTNASGLARSPRTYTLDDNSGGGDGDTDDAGEFSARILNYSTTAGNYIGGGVWRRTYMDSGGTMRRAVGAFMDGENPTPVSQVRALRGRANYLGQNAVGYYSTNVGTLGPNQANPPVPNAGTEMPGFFNAVANLTVEFGTQSEFGTISGELNSFTFTNADGSRSFLQDAIGLYGRLIVYLDETDIVNNSFNGVARAPAIRYRGHPVYDDGNRYTGERADGTAARLNLRGQYGGQFYGDTNFSFTAPGLGITFGLTDFVNGISISLIGALGFDGVILPSRFYYFPTFYLAPHVTLGSVFNDSHDRYIDATRRNDSFFDIGATTGVQSVVALSSNEATGTPQDRAYLAFDTATTNAPSSMSIDVANDYGGAAVADLTSSTSFTTQTFTEAETANTDRRINNGLGTDGEGPNDDPEWRYTTHTATLDNDADGVGGFNAYLVDWSSDANNYISGGVWTRVYDSDSTAAVVPTPAVGAFVDGSNPTELTELRDATGTATYRGHSQGHYSLRYGIEGENNPGRFSAKTTIDVNFGADSANVYGTMTGAIHDFLFSTGDEFTAAQTSTLQTPLGGPDGLRVQLLTANITDQNTFDTIDGGTAIGSGLIQFSDADRHSTGLAGQWSGRFYGTPSGSGANANKPPAVAGTWGIGASIGATVQTVRTDSFYFIGTFGAKLDETP